MRAIYLAPAPPPRGSMSTSSQLTLAINGALTNASATGNMAGNLSMQLGLAGSFAEAPSVWEENDDPGFTPMLPWAAGYGSNTYGGSGRDALTGGGALAATQTIYFIGDNDDLIECLAATGRRTGIFYKSGVYDFGENGELELRNDGRLTLVDPSPNPGTVIKGAYLAVWALQDIALINVTIMLNVTDPDAAAFGAGSCIGFVDPSDTMERFWMAYCGFMYAVDQGLGCGYYTDDCGLFACLVAKGLQGSVHPDNGGDHSTGFIADWSNRAQHWSMLRTRYVDNAGRNPLSSIKYLDFADGVVCNWDDEATTLGESDTVDGGSLTDYPTNTNIRNVLYMIGPDNVGQYPIRLWGLHLGSRLHIQNNRARGWPDDDQDDLIVKNPSYPGFNPSNEASPISTAASPGYVTNEGMTDLQLLNALINTTGPRPASPISAIADINTELLVTYNTPGTGGGFTQQGDEDYPTLAVNTATWTDIPGITSIVTGGVALGTAGRTMVGDYTAFELWWHSLLVPFGIQP